jgi:cysteinyl-tRNA synthetase
MQWPSPWGHGYPGWHIECSAMSQEYLGDTLDIHTGGEDNIFPHHEAEIAQSEGSTGKTFSNFFMHVRHMMINGEKMAKSKGNFLTLEDIQEKGYDPMDLRIVFLGAHYRSQMNFTDTSLSQAKKNKEKLFGTYARLLAESSEANRPVASAALNPFLEALYDDLNTPLALAKALELSTKYNKTLDQKADLNPSEALQNLQVIFQLFGLQFTQGTDTVPEEVQNLATLRQEARAQKDFAQADKYRTEMEALGYTVKDTDSGFEIAAL